MEEKVDNAGEYSLEIVNGVKQFRSANYNYNFRINDGYFEEYADKPENDVDVAPFPNIADIEISEDGCPNNCAYCYKASNVDNPTNMPLETLQKVLAAFPKVNGIETLTQVAYGITGITTHPQMFEIFDYTRSLGIIPNVTISGFGLTKELAKRLANTCGAVAVSFHKKEECYNAIEMLTNEGMKQVNMHFVVEDASHDKMYQVFRDTELDHRLAKLNAVVLLGMKNKGRAETRKPLSKYLFSKAVNFALDSNIRIGMDSCSANSVIDAIRDRHNFKDIEKMIMPCESTRESIYVSCQAKAYPCSFTNEFYTGINMKEVKSFDNEVWNNVEFNEFRGKLKKSCNSCPHFKIYQ